MFISFCIALSLKQSKIYIFFNKFSYLLFLSSIQKSREFSVIEFCGIKDVTLYIAHTELQQMYLCCTTNVLHEKIYFKAILTN